jgi:uncharacterized protein (UPF0261 family)
MCAQARNSRLIEGGLDLKTIAIIGTMDSKGTEYAFINDILKGLGLNTLLIHCGVFAPTIKVDVSNEEVFKAADADLASIVAKKDRATATEAAARGVEKLVPKTVCRRQV